MKYRITPALRALLWELVDYMENRQDADHNGISFVPNQEMRFAMELREHLGHFKPNPRMSAKDHRDHDYHKNQQEKRDERGYFQEMAGRNEDG